MAKHFLGGLLFALNNRFNPLDLSVDLETRQGMIACIGLSTSIIDAICIPFMCVERKEGYFTAEQEFILVKLLRAILTHPMVRIIGQNFLYDAQYIALWWNVVPKISFDTMIMLHLCFPGTPLDLGYLSSMFCDYHVYWKDEGKEWDESVDENQLWVYNCKDARATFEIKLAAMALIEHFGLISQWNDICEELEMILYIMLRGFLVDAKRKARIAGELMILMSEYETRFEKILSIDAYIRKPKAKPWYRSATQQAEIFYDLLGIREIKDRKTGNRTVNDAALMLIGQRESSIQPLITLMQEYRSLGVFYSTFATARIDPDTRMRSSFSPTAETFRWRSSKNAFGGGGNMQNIPEGSEED